MEETDGIDGVQHQILLYLPCVPMEEEDQMEHVVGHVVRHSLEEELESNVDLYFWDALHHEAFLPVSLIVVEANAFLGLSLKTH